MTFAHGDTGTAQPHRYTAWTRQPIRGSVWGAPAAAMLDVPPRAGGASSENAMNEPVARLAAPNPLPPPAAPGMAVHEVDTPALLLDLDAFEHNLTRLTQSL